MKEIKISMENSQEEAMENFRNAREEIMEDFRNASKKPLDKRLMEAFFREYCPNENSKT